MLQSLNFPDLNYQEQAIIKRKKSKSIVEEKVTLYKLDWKQSDDYKKKKWLNNPVTVKFMDLPEPYNQIAKDSLFLIPHNYYIEIIRNFAEANKEWILEKPFNETIQRICIKPAVLFVNTGFRLIADCLYDVNTNYYNRTDLKNIMAEMLMYKFWCMQVDNRMVRSYAGIDDIEDYLSDTVKTFYETIHKYELNYK